MAQPQEVNADLVFYPGDVFTVAAAPWRRLQELQLTGCDLDAADAAVLAAGSWTGY